MAAALTSLAFASTTTNGTSYAQTFSPTAGSLVFAFIQLTGSNSESTTLVGSAGLTFTLVGSESRSPGNRLYLYVANQSASAGAQTMTMDCSSDAATGCDFGIFEVTGITKRGAAAIRQSIAANGLTGAAMQGVLPAACLTGNVVISAVGYDAASGPATQPSTWTATGHTSHATPSGEVDMAHKLSGYTGTTPAWSNGPTNWSFIAAEIDVSASGSRSFGVCIG